MSFVKAMHFSTEFSRPPPGSVNVLLGDPVEGPGGRWIPCVTKIEDDVYWPSLFRVGAGQSQVCAIASPTQVRDEALVKAIALAACAAA